MEVGLSLGSNRGDRLAHFLEARRRIWACPGVQKVACSSVYETEPVGVKEEYQHLTFLNAVLIVEDDRGPEAWLSEIGAIEASMGRERTEERNAPRPIDIDILYVGDFMIHEPGLVLPHPRWADREFVVRPLAEIRPDLVLPGTGLVVREVLRGFGESNDVKVFKAKW